MFCRKIEAIDSVRRQSRVVFSNASLSYKYCQKKAIDAIKHVMLTRRRDRIRAEFVRAMDSRFHVRNVKLEFRGNLIFRFPMFHQNENVRNYILGLINGRIKCKI